MRKGYVQVYTGNGKGKTTAAFGLALRAAGAGQSVYIGQFIKSRKCSEHKIFDRLSDLITVRQFGLGLILKREPSEADIEAAQNGLREIREVVAAGRHDMVILDEINVAAHLGLVSVENILGLIAMKPESVEIVITGRYADSRVLDAADLVTEMTEIKHYSGKGVKSRVGIEE